MQVKDAVRRIALMSILWPAMAIAGHAKPCVTADEASKLVNQDVCVSAFVFDVVELRDGTRFLDVCTPQTLDEACRFKVVSLREDRDQVGELNEYRNINVEIRGIVRPMHGRAGMVRSHARQFNGGPPKFKLNSKLLRGFSAEEGRPAVSDPNLRSQGRDRAFMNTRDQEKMN